MPSPLFLRRYLTHRHEGEWCQVGQYPEDARQMPQKVFDKNHLLTTDYAIYRH